MKYPISHELVMLGLKVERQVASCRGHKFGWTNADKRYRQIVMAVAREATKAKIGDMTAEEFSLPFSGYTDTGIKYRTANSQQMTTLHQLVGEVQSKVGYSSEQLSEDVLALHVAQAIEDKKSGALDARTNNKRPDDRYDFIDDWLF